MAILERNDPPLSDNARTHIISGLYFSANNRHTVTHLGHRGKHCRQVQSHGETELAAGLDLVLDLWSRMGRRCDSVFSFSYQFARHEWSWLYLHLAVRGQAMICEGEKLPPIRHLHMQPVLKLLVKGPAHARGCMLSILADPSQS